MKVFSFSWRQARREWRVGEMKALAAALLISAAALSAVGSFTDRVGSALKAGANELLAADLALRSRQAIDPEWVEEAERRNLGTALTVEFPSVVFAGEQSLLITAKGVTSGYPLRGVLQVSDQPFGPSQPADGVPDSNSVWVASRVFVELDIESGGLVEFGDLQIPANKVVALEPDQSNSVFNVAPRVLFNFDDLERLGLLEEGSRARYQLLVAGESGAVADFQDWLAPRISRGQFFETVAENQQQVGSALNRSNRFLSLAALTAVILSGIAIVIAVRHFVRRHLDTVAILRCLGARRNPVLASFALQLLWVAIPALTLGCLLGYGAQFLLISAMGDLLPAALPPPGLSPALVAFATGLIALLGYGIPPLLALGRVPPVRVLNRQLGQPAAGQLLVYLLPVAFSVGLIAWLAQDLKLTVSLAGGLAITIAVLTLAAFLLVRLLKRFAGSRNVSWQFGLANVSKRGSGTQLQMAGLGLSLMVLLLLAVVQRDLLAGWRESIPERAPNFFMINVQPQQVDSVQKYLADSDLESQGLYPMATARLLRINGETPNAADYTDRRAESRINGTINVSWAEAFPRGNTLVAGEWWENTSNAAEISLASSWAEVFGLEVGDTMTVSVGATEVSARISSIRKVDWDSMEVNFFILLSPNALGDGELPRTYLGAVYAPGTAYEQITGLNRLHSNISIVDVGSVMQRVRTIINRVSLTVQVVFLFTLLAGLTVLVASLTAGLAQRTYEGAVLRTLGGSREQLRRAVLAEFSLIGAVSGFLAGVAAVIIGWLLARQVFDIPYTFSWWLPLAGMLAGALIVAALGLIGNRPVLNTPPILVLRS